MKKRNIINLIKYHAEKNEIAFRNEAHEIAKEMDRTGDEQLADYIMTLIAESNTFVPQQFDSATLDDSASKFFEEMPDQTDMLLLPSAIVQDLLGIVNAVKHRIGVNKFMLKGDPGSGKTEAVKQLAHILGRKIYMVNTAMLVDSKLGQTQKNIAELFREIGNFVQPEKALVLFDELDAIALDRTKPGNGPCKDGDAAGTGWSEPQCRTGRDDQHLQVFRQGVASPFRLHGRFQPIFEGGFASDCREDA